MSFFSSLRLFYPGRPPRITVGNLQTLSDELRAVVSSSFDRQTVQLNYGDVIDKDRETTHPMKEVYPNMWQLVDYSWDHEKEGTEWEKLWPKPAYRAKSVYRGYVSLAWLPQEISTEFTATHPTDNSCFIAPDSLTLSINPFSPAALGDEEERDVCGFVSLSFAGNGYFSWREKPFDAYWQQVRESPTLKRVHQLCRESFTVPPLPDIEEIKTNLGPLFLNRDEYREGDWIVSVSETG